MQRSRKADYMVPANIKENLTSPELKHLLSRMLNPNPQQRATMDEIWRDPWFCIDLPEAATTLNDRCMSMHHQAGHQSEAQVRSIWQAARQSPTQSDLIADVIDDYDEDESMTS